MKLARAVLADLDQADYRRLVGRAAVPDPDIRAAARKIVAAVAAGGDGALADAAARFG